MKNMLDVLEWAYRKGEAFNSLGRRNEELRQTLMQYEPLEKPMSADGASFAHPKVAAVIVTKKKSTKRK